MDNPRHLAVSFDTKLNHIVFYDLMDHPRHLAVGFDTRRPLGLPVLMEIRLKSI